MSTFTIANVQRPAGTALLNGSGVPVQLDEASWTMALYYGNGHPHDVYTVFVQYWTLCTFQRDDLLVDVQNDDPLTGAPALYRIVSNPRPWPDGHTEFIANRYVGKQL